MQYTFTSKYFASNDVFNVYIHDSGNIFLSFIRNCSKYGMTEKYIYIIYARVYPYVRISRENSSSCENSDPTEMCAALLGRSLV